jgi:hypothetical protein
MKTNEQIRYDTDANVSMVWCDGEPVRCPTQEDLDTLPVGPDMDQDEVEMCDE